MNPDTVTTPSEGKAVVPIDVRYDVKDMVGEGGMGRVLVAQDRELGRVVALKHLRTELTASVDSFRRFILEAQVGAQLEHPNIVPLYSFERTPAGLPAFAMRLVEGRTMAELIDEAREAPPEARGEGGEHALKARLGYLVGVCDALHFAHVRGVIHRDLKPENVMLGPFHEVYVMDWGLARVTSPDAADPSLDGPPRIPVPSAVADGGERAGVIESPTSRGAASAAESVALGATLPAPDGVAPLATASALDDVALGATIPAADDLALGATLHAPDDDRAADTVVDEKPGGAAGGKRQSRATRQGAVMGTPQYMAPEQALGKTAEVGPASDQFALGLILQELATLRAARSLKPMTALVQASRGEIGPMVDVDDVPLDPALAAVIARATAFESKDRYPSVEEFADDLRRFIRDEPVSVYEEGRAKKLARAASRRPALAVGVVAGALLVAAAIAIGTLTTSARHAEQHAREVDGLRAVLVAVGGRAHEIDVRLSDAASGVYGVAATAGMLLGQPLPSTPAVASSRALVLTPSPAHSGVPVSFAGASVTWAGAPSGAPEPGGAAVLRAVEPALRATLEVTLSDADAGAPRDARERALTQGRAGLLRAFIALDDGSFAQYPAREIPHDYDARRRPWYPVGVATPRLHWSKPMVSMGGRQVRMQALAAVRGSDGVVRGVAGCDLRVEVLARSLALGLPAEKRAYLVAEDGRIVVRPGLEASVLATGAIEPDAPVAFERVDRPALAAKIAARDEGGAFEDSDGTLVAYARLVSPPWTYVVELDAKRALRR